MGGQNKCYSDLDHEGVAGLAAAAIARRLVEGGDVFVRVADARDAVARAISALHPDLAETVDSHFAESVLHELIECSMLPLYYVEERHPDGLMLLVPRELVSGVDATAFQLLLDEVADLVRLYRGGVIDYGQLKEAAARLLFDRLAGAFEGYERAVDWYHGALMRAHDLADEEREVGGSAYYRIGDVWLKKSAKYALRGGLLREVLYYTREELPN